MGRRMGDNLKVGAAVKYSGWAFDSGVARRNKQTLGQRGSVVRIARNDPELLVVQWGHKKTLDRLHRSFLMRATTAARR